MRTLRRGRVAPVGWSAAPSATRPMTGSATAGTLPVPVDLGVGERAGRADRRARERRRRLPAAAQEAGETDGADAAHEQEPRQAERRCNLLELSVRLGGHLAALAVAQVRRAEAARAVARQRPRLEIVGGDVPEVPAVGLGREQVGSGRACIDQRERVERVVDAAWSVLLECDSRPPAARRSRSRSPHRGRARGAARG